MTAIDIAVIIMTLWAVIIIHAIKLRNGTSGRQSNWTRNTQVISSKSRCSDDAKLHVGHSAAPEKLAGALRVVWCDQLKGMWREDGNVGGVSFPRHCNQWPHSVADNNRHVSSHSAGGHKPKVQVLAGPCSLSRLLGRIIPWPFLILVVAGKFWFLGV